MRLLLDTHIFLWYISADDRLSAFHRAAIEDRANEVFLSAASVWEAVIKHNLGKLPLPAPPAGASKRQALVTYAGSGHLYMLSVGKAGDVMPRLQRNCCGRGTPAENSSRTAVAP